MITLKSVPGTPGEPTPIPTPRGGDRRSAEFRARQAALKARLTADWHAGRLKPDEMIEKIVEYNRSTP